MGTGKTEYYISNDKALLCIETICRLLSKSYWASARDRETVERSIDNSICFGAYEDNRQVGFARVVTDYATIYWVCDVLVDEAHRGRGIGKELVKAVVNSAELRSLRGILRTKDAHGLYEQYGFVKDPESFMFRQPKL